MTSLQQRSTKGASKQRRDNINSEVSIIRSLLPLPDAVRQRLSQLQVMAMCKAFIGKSNILSTATNDPSELLFQLCDFTQALPGFLVVTDQKGCIVYLSDNTVDYLAHSMVDIVSQSESILGIVHPDDRHHFTQALQFSKKTSLQSTVFSCRMGLMKHPRRNHAFDRYKRMKVCGRLVGGEGETCFLVALCTPHLDPLMASEALPPLDTLLFHSSHSLDMKFLCMADNGKMLLGYPGNQIVGMSWYSLLHPDDIETAVAKHKQLMLSSESVVSWKVRIQKGDGDMVWVQVVMKREEGKDDIQGDHISCCNQLLHPAEVKHAVCGGALELKGCEEDEVQIISKEKLKEPLKRQCEKQEGKDVSRSELMEKLRKKMKKNDEDWLQEMPELKEISIDDLQQGPSAQQPNTFPSFLPQPVHTYLEHPHMMPVGCQATDQTAPVSLTPFQQPEYLHSDLMLLQHPFLNNDNNFENTTFNNSNLNSINNSSFNNYNFNNNTINNSSINDNTMNNNTINNNFNSNKTINNNTSNRNTINNNSFNNNNNNNLNSNIINDNFLPKLDSRTSTWSPLSYSSSSSPFSTAPPPDDLQSFFAQMADVKSEYVGSEWDGVVEKELAVKETAVVESAKAKGHQLLTPKNSFPELGVNDVDECLKLLEEHPFIKIEAFDNSFSTQPIHNHPPIFNQPPTSSCNQPPTTSFNQPPTTSFNQPPTTSFNQTPTPSFNQPPTTSFNQPPTTSFNQPPPNSFNQPPPNSFNQPPPNSFNQPPTTSFNQPPTTSFNQTPTTSFNQTPTTSFNQPPTTSFNQPPPNSFNQPPPNSFNQPPPNSFNQTPTTSFNQPPTPSFNQPPTTSFNQPPTPSFNQPPTTSFNQPPPKSFNPLFSKDLSYEDLADKLNSFPSSILSSVHPFIHPIHPAAGFHGDPMMVF